MKKTDHFERIVVDSNADQAKKDVAMNVVDASKPLENGGAADVKSISNHLLAITPLLLQLYLQDDMHMQILAHEQRCQHKGCTASAVLKTPLPSNIKEAFFMLLGKMPWPVAVILSVLMYYDEISAILRTLSNH